MLIAEPGIMRWPDAYLDWTGVSVGPCIALRISLSRSRMAIASAVEICPALTCIACCSEGVEFDCCRI